MDADQYGISKKKAADWIKSTGSNTKMIKASIIGPELSQASSMLYWFLSNKDYTEVNGYTNHLWNGITTFYWAKFSKDLMENWDNYNTTTVLDRNKRHYRDKRKSEGEKSELVSNDSLCAQQT